MSVILATILIANRDLLSFFRKSDICSCHFKFSWSLKPKKLTACEFKATSLLDMLNVITFDIFKLKLKMFVFEQFRLSLFCFNHLEISLSTFSVLCFTISFVCSQIRAVVSMDQFGPVFWASHLAVAQLTQKKIWTLQCGHWHVGISVRKAVY